MTNLTGTIVVGPEEKRLNLYIPRVYLDQIGVNKPRPKVQVTGLSGQWLKIESSDVALEAKIPSHLTVKFEGQFLPKDRAYIQWTPRRGFGLSPTKGKWENLELKVLGNSAHDSQKVLLVRIPNTFFDQRTPDTDSWYQHRDTPKPAVKKSNGSIDFNSLQEAVTIVNNAIDSGAEIKKRHRHLVIVANVELS